MNFKLYLFTTLIGSCVFSIAGMSAAQQLDGGAQKRPIARRSTHSDSLVGTWYRDNQAARMRESTRPPQETRWLSYSYTFKANGDYSDITVSHQGHEPTTVYSQNRGRWRRLSANQIGLYVGGELRWKMQWKLSNRSQTLTLREWLAQDGEWERPEVLNRR